MRLYTETILPVGTPTPAGRIYPREVAEEMAKQINSGSFYLVSGSVHDAIPVERIAGTVTNARVEAGSLKADLTLIKTPTGELINALVEEKAPLSYYTAATGMVDANSVVSGVKCIAVCVDAKPAIVE